MSTSPTPTSAPSQIGRWLAVLATVVVVATLVAAEGGRPGLEHRNPFSFAAVVDVRRVCAFQWHAA